MGMCSISKCILAVGLFLLCSQGEAKVIGNPQLIVALAGDDVILPCHLEPPVDATHMTVDWSKSYLEPKYVHVRRSGKELVNDKNPAYRQRTSLFISELSIGNVSLKLSKVDLPDEGTYKCFIPSLSSESFIQLVVGVISEPKISIVGSQDGGTILQCESGGWNPKPEVEWLDSEGHVLSDGLTETVQNYGGLFTVTSKATLLRTDTNRFTCRVQQQQINQTRETEIHVPDNGSEAWIIFLVLGVIFVILIIVAALVFFCRRKKSQPEHQKKADKPSLIATLKKCTEPELEKFKQCLRDGNFISLATVPPENADSMAVGTGSAPFSEERNVRPEIANGRADAKGEAEPLTGVKIDDKTKVASFETSKQSIAPY